MTSEETINELETKLSDARELAAEFLKEVKAEGYRQTLSESTLTRAREISAQFHPGLVRLSSLVRQSPMFGDSDVQALRLVIRRIDAALRLRKFEEWGPEILNDEDTVLGVRP